MAQVQEYADSAKKALRIENEIESRQVLAGFLAYQRIEDSTEKPSEASIESLKAVALVLNEKELLEECDRALLASYTNKEVKLSGLQRQILRLYLRSGLRTTYSRDCETWVPIFMSALDLAEAVSVHRDISSHMEVLLSQVTSHKLLFLEKLILKMDALDKDTDALQLRLAVREVLTYLALVSKLNIANAGGGQYSAVAKALSGELAQVSKALSCIKQEYIFVSVCKALIRRGQHPGRILDLYSQYSGEKPELKAFWSGVTGNDGLGPVVVGLEEGAAIDKLFSEDDHNSDEGPLAAIARFFNPDAGSLIISPVVRRLDCIQLLDAYLENLQSLQRQVASRTVEVSDVNISRLKQILAQLKGREVTRQELIEIEKAVSRLLDVPIKPALYRYGNMLKDVSRRLSKQVQYRVRGDDIAIGRDKLYLLQDCLVHMLRNAIDHGIENSDERQQSKKSPVGLIEIEVRERDNHIELTVMDDGRGIDVDAVADKAIEKGLISSKDAEKMTEEQKMQFIFASNLSTKNGVSEISGRGVGMDIVKANVERLGGTVSVHSQVGKGTRLTISLNEV
jgi:signal transduction histidine kinase